MHWYDGETVSDVAEVGEPPRRNVPRWLRFGLLVLGAMVVGWLLLQRLTAADADIQVAEARFDSNFTVGLDLTVTNRIGDPQVVLPPKPPALPGLQYVGMFRANGATADTALSLAPHGRRTLTLAWRVRDCVPALAAGDREVVVPVAVGGTIGAKATLRVPVGPQRDLLPSVCNTSPTAGRPRLVDTEHELDAGNGAVQWTLVRVQNTGGRPLSFHDTVLPSGTAIDLNPRGRSTSTPVAVGDQGLFVLSFPSNDCRVPTQGPATVIMRFSTPGSDRLQPLEVRLADSWENFLGVCTSPTR